jgi:hypothetical protein
MFLPASSNNGNVFFSTGDQRKSNDGWVFLLFRRKEKNLPKLYDLILKYQYRNLKNIVFFNLFCQCCGAASFLAAPATPAPTLLDTKANCDFYC